MYRSPSPQNESDDELDIELIDTQDFDEIDLLELEEELTSVPPRSFDSKSKKTRKQAVFKEIMSYVQIFIIALILAYIVSFHIIVNATIPSGSMSNTIMTGDRVIGFRLAYLFSAPERGDIIIFKYPDNEEEDYIKRIIGIPGDTVEIIEGHVYVNGICLIEDYLAEPMAVNSQPLVYHVPEDSYFVMGDNRNHSRDSRAWQNTFVHRDKIIGKALFKYYKKFEFLN